LALVYLFQVVVELVLFGEIYVVMFNHRNFTV
jgi:hypothetical protein